MAKAVDILEIPIEKTNSISDLARWFEKEKVHEGKYSKLVIPEHDRFPAFVIVSIFYAVGMALVILEEKGRINTKGTATRISLSDFKNSITNSKSENTLEKLIESRYRLDLSVKNTTHQTKVNEPEEKYGLDDVFGMWKKKNINLATIRNNQWGKRK